MKRLMLIGECGAGKRTLIRALSGGLNLSRPLAVQFCGNFINTPGEFLENRRFYHALITASAECDLLALLQDATRRGSLFPPCFVASFSRPAVGLVTKIDARDADTSRAALFLENAGAKDILRVSAEKGTGLEDLREMLRWAA